MKKDTPEMMTEPSQLLRDYIENTHKSGALVRKLIFASVFASIFVFVGSWNIYPGSWMTTRLHQLRQLDVNSPNASPDSPGVASPESLADAANKLELLLQGMILENMMVRVPIFNVAFDVNDLGLFGGLSLLAISTMLWFSIKRKITNAEMVFREATSEGSLPACYRLLAMNQVLATVPRKGSRREVHERWLPKILFLPPIVAMSEITIVHLHSIRSMVTQYPVYGLILFLITLSLGALIGLLTVLIWKVSNNEDRIWIHAAVDAGIIPCRCHCPKTSDSE